MATRRSDVRPPGGVPRPGGRNERNRIAVARAVLDILEDGRSDITVAEVAARAGVHRSTIYRRWPTPSHLVAEALTVHTAKLQISDTGDWDRDLPAIASALATFFTVPVEVAMNRAMASGAAPSIAVALTAHWLPIIGSIRDVVTGAIERGQISTGTNPDMIVELLVSPILVRTMFLDEAGPAFVDALVMTVDRAVAIGPE